MSAQSHRIAQKGDGFYMRNLHLFTGIITMNTQGKTVDETSQGNAIPQQNQFRTT